MTAIPGASGPVSQALPTNPPPAQTKGWRFATIDDRLAITAMVADSAEQQSLRLTPPERRRAGGTRSYQGPPPEPSWIPSRLIRSLPNVFSDRADVIIYDCFGKGDYRNPAHPRHRHRDGFVQLATELAGLGLCLPIIPAGNLDPEKYTKALVRRLKQVSENDNQTFRWQSPSTLWMRETFGCRLTTRTLRMSRRRSPACGGGWSSVLPCR